MNVKGILTGGRQLAKLLKENASLGSLIQRTIDGVNAVADNAAVSSVGRMPPPPPINGVSVNVGGEYAQIVIHHSGAIQQGIQYAIEVSNNQNFSGAHLIDYGTSRTRDPIHLAPYDASGNTQKWYVRALAQYPGSNPTEPCAYGGASPTAITTTGTTKLTWNTSTGSGTSASTGQQCGWFYGKLIRRAG